jgi:O-antigen ligase
LIKFSDWKKNFIALSLAGGLQAVLAVVQFASQRVIASKWLGISAHAVYPLGDAVTETPVGRFLRSYGSFPHPNIFGGFMVIAFFATLFWLKTAKGHWKFAGWFFLILNFLGLFLSFSRSAWLGFALAFIFWLVMNLKEKETRLETAKIIFIVIAFSGVLVLNFWPILDTRISSSGRLEQKSNQGRITLLIQDVGVVKNKWFLGTGFGNYTYYLYQQDSSESAHDYQPVHNVFLLIWSELGIFGLIIFLTLLFFISWRVWLTRNWEALALILILLPISLVDHYLWTLYEGLIISALVIAFAFRSRSQCGLWKF